MNKDNTKIYVASAGTGKTTTLIQELEEVLKTVPPNRVAFTTFSKAGAEEIVARVCAKFGFETKQLPYFRTLHAICYNQIPPADMLHHTDFREFAKRTKVPITGYSVLNDDGTTRGTGTTVGDRMLTLDNTRRNRRATHRETLAMLPSLHVSLDKFEWFSRAFKEFKEDANKIDFTDQLENYLTHCNPLHIDVMFVDEAQDLSKLQWDVIRKMSENAKKVIVAGDDKQTIYEFSGADPNILIDMPGERIVLEETFRMPLSILKKAEEVAKRIERKTEYTTKTEIKGGGVHYITSIADVIDTKGSWLLLVRNRCFAEQVERELLHLNKVFRGLNPNVPFSNNVMQAITAWKALIAGHKISGSQVQRLYEFLPVRSAVEFGKKQKVNSLRDADLLSFDDLRKSYGLLTDNPWPKVFKMPERERIYLENLDKKNLLEMTAEIEVSTIHGAKGREADNVIVFPSMARQSAEGYRKQADSEHRVFYVACSRAKKNLFIHAPFGQTYYPL